MKKNIIIFMIFLFSNLVFSETRIEFEIDKGKYWEHDIKIGFIKKKATPQMAIWTEDLNGNFLGTIYVSNIWQS